MLRRQEPDDARNYPNLLLRNNIVKLLPMDKFNLHEKIRAAFADVPYPGDEAIGAPDGRDDAEHVTDWLRGQDWRALKSNELWPPALGFMTPEAFHYYLPAYLLAATEESGDVGHDLIWTITPPEQQEDLQPTWLFEASFQSKYRRFTSVQKEAVREFIDWWFENSLRLCQELGDPIDDEHMMSLRALKEYWDHF